MRAVRAVYLVELTKLAAQVRVWIVAAREGSFLVGGDVIERDLLALADAIPKVVLAVAHGLRA